MKKSVFILLILNCLLYCVKADWVQVNNGITQLNIDALTATGNYIFAGSHYSFPGGVFRSFDNGNNWQQVHYLSAWALASQDSFVYSGYPNGVLRSTNYGTNWGSGNLNLWTNALLTDSNYVYAGCFYPLHNTNNGVWVSTNYGENWSQTPLNNVDIYALTKSGNYLFAGGNGIFFSTNNGANWQLSTNTGAWSLASNGNYIFAGGAGVIVSTNYGINWTQTPLTDDVHALAVYGNYVFAAGGFWVSTDNGTSWVQRIEGMGNLYVNTLCISNENIFAGTDGYGVFRRPLSELLGLEPVSHEIPVKFRLEQNYPNPFNANTKIRFSIPVNSKIQLKIFDVLGRIKEIPIEEKLQPSEYELTFDASNCSSGVYFYQLIINGDIFDSKKMVIVK